MYTFRLYDVDGEFVVEAPLVGEQYELEIPRDCYVKGGHFCYDGHVLAFWESPHPRHLGVGDWFNLKLVKPFEKNDDDIFLLLAACLRFKTNRILPLLMGIHQLGNYFRGQKTRVPVHHFRPQTPPDDHQAVPDEEQQPLRRWSPRRLVQWFFT